MKLPLPPTKLDSREDFVNKMDAFVTALPKCIDELQVYVDEMKLDTENKLASILAALQDIQALHLEVQKSRAVVKETQLVAAQGLVQEWKAGVTYNKGDAVYSPLNARVYKARVQISNNEDPSISINWQPAILHTGLFIDKAYAPRTLQTETHWLILKEGEYTLPEASTNEEIQITNLTNLPCTFSVTKFRGIDTGLTLVAGESRTLQYSGSVYGWI